MSKFNKKNLILGLGVLSVATLGTVGITTNAFVGNNQEVRDAISSGDFEGFKTALSNQSSERLESKLANLDEEKFAQIQQRFNQKEAVKTAIENNDYDAFVEATENSDSSKFKDITEEEFAEIVEKKAEAEEFKSELTAAVESGNQEEFNNLLTTKYQEKAENNSGENNQKELTEEKLQELWEKANQQFEDNGEINLKTGRKGRRGNKFSR